MIINFHKREEKSLQIIYFSFSFFIYRYIYDYLYRLYYSNYRHMLHFRVTI